MSKVRILSLIVLLAMLLGACSPQKQNLGEEFLQNHDEEDYKQIVMQANYLLFGNIAEFDDPQKLSLRNILNLYLKINPSYDNCQTSVDLDNFEQFTKEYLAEDIYDYAKLKNDLAPMAAKFSEDELIFNYEFLPYSPYKDDKINIENVGSDGGRIEIDVLLEMKDTPDIVEGKLTLKIIENSYQFLSYEIPRAPFAVGDITFPFLETISKEQLENYFGEITVVDQFEMYPGIYAKRCLGTDGTEIYLSDGIDDKVVVYRLSTTNPKLELVKGIKVGDNLQSVVSKFADSGYETAYDETLGEYRLLYGQIIHGANFGYIAYENKEAKELIYNQERIQLILEISDNLISKIAIVSEM